MTPICARWDYRLASVTAIYHINMALGRQAFVFHVLAGKLTTLLGLLGRSLCIVYTLYMRSVIEARTLQGLLNVRKTLNHNLLANVNNAGYYSTCTRIGRAKGNLGSVYMAAD